MEITALGHSAFILNMFNQEKVSCKILVDPWLSDCVIGDMLGRFPRLELNQEFFNDDSFDSIFLSHAHTDHFDPYSLVMLNKNCSPKTIFLPQSIEYLADTLRKHLPKWPILILKENDRLEYNGHWVSALHNLEQNATNEDDVMLLLVENETELFLNEADAILPLYDPEKREIIESLWQNPQLKTICYLSTKNELDATMSSAHAQSIEQRQEAVQGAYDRLLDELQKQFEAYADPSEDFWSDPRLVRCLIGQGICYPQELDTQMNKVLFPITVEDRANLESELAKAYGYPLTIHALEAGQSYTIRSDKRNLDSTTTPLFSLRDAAHERFYEPELMEFTAFPDAPLRSLKELGSSTEAQRQLIQKLLNNRFLPWFVGRRTPPVEHILSSQQQCYRIVIRYGDADHYETRAYHLDFKTFRFTEDHSLNSTLVTSEEYWANDLEDFTTGHCDDFSTFCRQVPGGSSQSFWDCLGMPFLNNEFVLKKMELHFERAEKGNTACQWVLPYYLGAK